jgi:hypothetical protein
MSVPYWKYEDAFKAIHSALSSLLAPGPGKRMTRIAFDWNADATLAALRAYDDAILIFTLSFSWNVDGTLKEVSRTDA